MTETSGQSPSGYFVRKQARVNEESRAVAVLPVLNRRKAKGIDDRAGRLRREIWVNRRNLLIDGRGFLRGEEKKRSRMKSQARSLLRLNCFLHTQPRRETGGAFFFTWRGRPALACRGHPPHARGQALPASFLPILSPRRHGDPSAAFGRKQNQCSRQDARNAKRTGSACCSPLRSWRLCARHNSLGFHHLCWVALKIKHEKQRSAGL